MAVAISDLVQTAVVGESGAITDAIRHAYDTGRRSPVPPLPDRLPAFLGPLVALLGKERAQVAHHIVNEGLAAVAPVTNLWVAEADVIAARVRLGAESAKSAKELATRVSNAVEQAIARQEDRTRRILELTTAEATAHIAETLIEPSSSTGPSARRRRSMI